MAQNRAANRRPLLATATITTTRMRALSAVSSLPRHGINAMAVTMGAKTATTGTMVSVRMTGCWTGPVSVVGSVTSLRRPCRPVTVDTTSLSHGTRRVESVFASFSRGLARFSRLCYAAPGFRCYDFGVMMSSKAAPIEGEHPIAMVSVTSSAGYRGEIRAGRHLLVADEGPEVGGDDEGPQSVSAHPGRPGAVHRGHPADVRQPEGLGAGGGQGPGPSAAHR